MPDGTNSNPRITVIVWPVKRGLVKARAYVRIDFSASSLTISSLAIVQDDPAKPAWVRYPQRPVKYEKAILEITGVLHDQVCAAVLHQWEQHEALERKVEEAIDAFVLKELTPSSQTLEAWFPEFSETEGQDG